MPRRSKEAHHLPAGERGDRGWGEDREKQGVSGSLLQHLPIAYCAFRAGGGRGGGERQPVPKKPGSHFLPNRHLLAGHQIVLEGCISGGRRSHYRAASPLHFCPCVPAMEIRLRDLHKAPAIYYSAAACYRICWCAEPSRPGLAPAGARWASVSACAGG